MLGFGTSRKAIHPAEEINRPFHTTETGVLVLLVLMVLFLMGFTLKYYTGVQKSTVGGDSFNERSPATPLMTLNEGLTVWIRSANDRRMLGGCLKSWIYPSQLCCVLAFFSPFFFSFFLFPDVYDHEYDMTSVTNRSAFCFYIYAHAQYWRKPCQFLR